MFKKIMNSFRGWLGRMGLIKEITTLSEIKSIPVDDKFYSMLDMWKSIYQGYYPEWHRVKYHTIDGHKTRDMATLGMAKVISQEMASIIFNEKCEISISDQKFGEMVEKVLNENNFYSKFQQHLEYMFGMGGTVLKPYVEKDKIKISYVPADCFIPISWDHLRIYEGVFVYQTKKNRKYFTHLEFHLKEGTGYIVKNELYESDNSSTIGVKVPLSNLYPELEDEVSIDGLERPLFVYIHPNSANNLDIDSPLGLPIYSAAMDTLHSLDIAFDSFQREFRLGKKRILVPATAVRAVPDEHGNLVQYFDSTDEVYQAFTFGNLENQKIYDNSVELRVTEHVAAINALLNILAMQTGFSPGAFTFDGSGGVKTATEVVSENSKTFKTKQSHEVVIENGIKELIEVIKILADLYQLFPTPEDYEVAVGFDDSIAEDENAEIEKQIKLVTNKLTSQKRAIKAIHKCTDEEAEEILQEILEEERNQAPGLDELRAESALFGDEEDYELAKQDEEKDKKEKDKPKQEEDEE